MIDFAKRAEISKKADEKLNEILLVRHDTFDQYSKVSEIDDLEVAKVIIKRLLDKLS